MIWNPNCELFCSLNRFFFLLFLFMDLKNKTKLMNEIISSFAIIISKFDFEVMDQKAIDSGSGTIRWLE